MNRLPVLVLGLALTVPRPAQANDAAFGGIGGALIPLQQSQVQMREETIVLTAHHTLERWDVQSSYVFYNDDAAPITLQVGFPELTCPDDEDAMCTRVRFENLVTRVNGKPVAHREGKLAGHEEWSGYLGRVWLFDVTFAPHTETRIEHAYRTGSGIESSGARFTSYVTKTGIKWANTIGHAQFIARLPPFTHVVADIRSKGLTSTRPTLGKDGRIEIRAEAHKWTPTEDVEFYFNSDSRVCTDRVEPDDAQSCINDLYANKGYPFESAALRERYYSGGHEFEKRHGHWQRSTPMLTAFQPSWFTKREGQLLAEWRALAGSIAAASTKTLPGPSAPNPASDGSPRAREVSTTGLASAEALPSATPSGAVSTAAAPPSSTPPQTSNCACTLGRQNGSSLPFVWVLATFAGLALRRPSSIARFGPRRASLGKRS